MRAELQREIVDRAGGKCQGCGRPGTGRGLNVHHRNENQGDDAPTNLIVLCPSCHRKRHVKAQEWAGVKLIRLREIDAERLERLAEKLDRDQSWVIRHAIEALAKREKVTGGGD